MHYVKQFHINGVDTKQVACIELHGKPNAATEGYVGVLGIDMDSPLHEVYKCVAVNGAIYSWELLSSGLSIMSATITGEGSASVQFPYAKLLTPAMYVVKVGDLILDSEGYLYQITALNSSYCDATYTGTQIATYGKSAYDLAVKNGFEGSEEEWLASIKGDPFTYDDFTPEQLAALKGDEGAAGKSAYKQAQEGGYAGTEAEFIAELNRLAGLRDNVQSQLDGKAPGNHPHKKSEITDFPTSMTPTSHNQAASTITAGTFAGAVVANSNGQSYSTYCLRNTRLASSDTTPTVNGEICWVYK